MAVKKLKLEWAMDLSKALAGPIRNRISHIGVELEGGWDKNPTPHRVQRDGSVRDIPGYASIGDRNPMPGEGIAGEVSSPPLCVIKGFSAEAEPWVKKCYPKAINITCGMHVHMSFSTLLNYMRTMRSEYPITVVAEMKRWAKENDLPEDHPIWPRVEGKSDYCQFVYSGEEQILNRNRDYDKHRVGNRYSVINYNYGRTGTVECRLLPMMKDADLAVSAIRRLLDVTNAFLVVTAKREKQFDVKVEDDGSNREVREIYVN